VAVDDDGVAVDARGARVQLGLALAARRQRQGREQRQGGAQSPREPRAPRDQGRRSAARR
jgi:hypothetical protein